MGRILQWNLSHLSSALEVRPIRPQVRRPRCSLLLRRIFRLRGGTTSQVPVFSLFYCQGTESICGGVIGSGNNGGTQRFCSKSSGECNVSKHISNKVLLRKGYLYIKCPRGGQAWLKPSVDVGRLPSNCDIPLMISSEKPHDVWTAYFNSIEAVGTQQLRAVTGLSLEDASKSSWEEVEAPGIEKL
jgi:hypothetical protein